MARRVVAQVVRVRQQREALGEGHGGAAHGRDQRVDVGVVQEARAVGAGVAHVGGLHGGGAVEEEREAHHLGGCVPVVAVEVDRHVQPRGTQRAHRRLGGRAAYAREGGHGGRRLHRAQEGGAVVVALGEEMERDARRVRAQEEAAAQAQQVVVAEVGRDEPHAQPLAARAQREGRRVLGAAARRGGGRGEGELEGERLSRHDEQLGRAEGVRERRDRVDAHGGGAALGAQRGAHGAHLQLPAAPEADALGGAPAEVRGLGHAGRREAERLGVRRDGGEAVLRVVVHHAAVEVQLRGRGRDGRGRGEQLERLWQPPPLALHQRHPAQGLAARRAHQARGVLVARVGLLERAERLERGAVVLVRVGEARVQLRRRAEAARGLRVARRAVVHDADVRVGVRVLRLQREHRAVRRHRLGRPAHAHVHVAALEEGGGAQLGPLLGRHVLGALLAPGGGGARAVESGGERGQRRVGPPQLRLTQPEQQARLGPPRRHAGRLGQHRRGLGQPTGQRQAPPSRQLLHSRRRPLEGRRSRSGLRRISRLPLPPRPRRRRHLWRRRRPRWR